jgi:hypothetical protein
VDVPFLLLLDAVAILGLEVLDQGIDVLILIIILVDLGLRSTKDFVPSDV